MPREKVVLGPYAIYSGEMDDAIVIARNSKDGTPAVTLDEVVALLRKAGVV